MNDETKTTAEATEETTAERTPFEEFMFHQRRALEETGKALESLLPEGFRQHSKEATKEFSKGFRVLMDSVMDEIKKAKDTRKAQAEDAPTISTEDITTTGKTKVKVQVD